MGALNCWADSMGFVCLVTLNESDKNSFNGISVLTWDRFEQQSILSIFPTPLLSQVFYIISFFLHLSRLNWCSWNSAIPASHQELRPLPENWLHFPMAQLYSQHQQCAGYCLSEQVQIQDPARKCFSKTALCFLHIWKHWPASFIETSVWITIYSSRSA